MGAAIAKAVVEGKDLYEVLSTPMFIVSLQACIKGLVMLSNKRHVENITDDLGQVWRTDNMNEEQKRVRQLKAKELRYAAYAYIYFPQLIAWQYMLLPLFMTLYFNVLLGDGDEMRLPLDSVYPFDPTSNLLFYGITYFYQVYCLLVVVHVYLGSDFNLITLTSHLTVEFLMLSEDLLHIKPKKVTSTGLVYNKENIIDFVKKHQKLTTIAQELDVAMNVLMFINIFFTTLNVGFFGLSALSEGIFFAASKNPWYEGNIEYKKTMSFIMLRSQKPCYITSMRYTKVTLETFTKVLSRTWSYFSLVYTMYKRSK
ncbi:odorant receptor 49a-like [Amyelois transitella]|uniref:odorant receptor 49a-like n=1 Tax=Amyelois transitella TaxID=680683 RepID=UPI00067BDD2F|nr:odorant receptor 49a-like [Amyelois transitella]